MATTPYREQLLAQATQLNRGATRKISRLKTQKDVLVSGTEYDPRKPQRLLKRYTTKQLESFISRASQFNARTTQFVPDAHRRPIPAAEFKPLHVAEIARKRTAEQQLDAVGKFTTSSGTETIRQRRDKMRSDRKLAGNPTVQDPYNPRVRDSKNVASRKALKDLVKEAKQKAKPGWDKQELKRQIGEYSQMAARVGDAELDAAVKQLTPKQFRVLWNDTNFANAMGIRYEQVQHGLIDEDDKAWHAQLIRDAFVDARLEVDWAKTLDLGDHTKESRKNMMQARKEWFKTHGTRPWIPKD